MKKYGLFEGMTRFNGHVHRKTIENVDFMMNDIVSDWDASLDKQVAIEALKLCKQEMEKEISYENDFYEQIRDGERDYVEDYEELGMDFFDSLLIASDINQFIDNLRMDNVIETINGMSRTYLFKNVFLDKWDDRIKNEKFVELYNILLSYSKELLEECDVESTMIN